MSCRQIILLTDFGPDNFYISMIKSVIYTIKENCKVIDFTHSIEPQNVRQASFLLMSSQQYFPQSSIFLSIVDSEVGTDRLILGIKAKNKYFVAPDNGLLSFLTINTHDTEVYKLTNSSLLPKCISSTFHGRDVFSYYVAYIASGLSLDLLGEQINPQEIKKLNLEPKFEKNSIIGEVMHIDNYGNLITNIDNNSIRELLGNGKIKIKIKDFKLENIHRTFSDVNQGELLSYIGSLNYLEIAQNMGNAAKLLNVKIGDIVKIFL